MTYFCSTCVVSWFPYMTNDGACPGCGGGTKRTQEPASLDAQERHNAILARRVSKDRHDRFEHYYAEREATREFADLPVVEPKRAA